MLEDDHKVVYFDPEVRDKNGNWIGGTWIGVDNAQIISTFFEGKKYQKKSLAELGKWMRRILSSGESAKSILVFAQDVAPYDVFDNLSSNCIARQYLDQGGTILWMGDIPFYCRTKWAATPIFGFVKLRKQVLYTF